MAKDFDLAHAGRLSLFETIIRIVGGLIAAFDASGDQMFLQKALELAQKLQVNFPKGGKGTGHRDMVLSSQHISLLAIWHPVCLSYKARTREGSDRSPQCTWQSYIPSEGAGAGSEAASEVLTGGKVNAVLCRGSGGLGSQ